MHYKEFRRGLLQHGDSFFEELDPAKEERANAKNLCELIPRALVSEMNPKSRRNRNQSGEMTN